jgi:uncharacterized protein (DUF433 family)
MEASRDALSLINVGIYSVPVAARMASLGTGRHVPTAWIHRWLWGKNYKVDGETQVSKPLWNPELSILHDRKVLSFRDLIEVMFVAAFRHRGVPLQTIRRIIDKAATLAAAPYPLSSPSFKTCYRTVVADALSPEDQRIVFELESGQQLLELEFDKLRAGIDFSSIMEASMWWPLGKDRQVVVDPSRRFGEAIVADSGVPTAVLNNTYVAEGSYDAVCYWYGVSELEARDAVEYQQRIEAA